MVNYEEAVKKPFTDLAKLFLGIVLSTIPIVNWVAQGFIIECSGVGKNRPSKSMPVWKELGNLFSKGFLSILIMIIYAIPAILVFLITFGYAASLLMPTLGGLMPEGFISSVVTGQVTGEEISGVVSQNSMQILPALTEASIIVFPFLLLGMILLLAAIYLYPIAILNYLKNKKFGKAFDFNFIISKAFTAKYLISWLIAGITSIVIKSFLVSISWVGLWLGPAIAFFISGVIAYSLFGQVFREK